MIQNPLCKAVAALLLGPFTVQAAATPSLEIKIGTASAEQVLAHFRSCEPITPEETFTLALAHLGTFHFREAIDRANQSLSRFEDPNKKAICYRLIAQAYGALGDYEQAASAATTGQFIAPESRELAAMRIVYYDKLGDELQKQAAREHLMRLDPQYKRNPKMDPVTGAVVITALLVAAIVVVCETIKTEDDPQTKQRLADAINTLARAAGSLAMITKLAN